MKRKESKYFQEFYDRFMKVYNAIPAQFKPPIGSSQLHYVEAFDSDFILWLSERRSASLAYMMNDAIEIEIGLTTDRDKRREEEEEGRIGSLNIPPPLTHKMLEWTQLWKPWTG